MCKTWFCVNRCLLQGFTWLNNNKCGTLMLWRCTIEQELKSYPSYSRIQLNRMNITWVTGHWHQVQWDSIDPVSLKTYRFHFVLHCPLLNPPLKAASWHLLQTSNIISCPGAGSGHRICGRLFSLCSPTQALCVGPGSPCLSLLACPRFSLRLLHVLVPGQSRGWWVYGKVCLCHRTAAVPTPSSLPARHRAAGGPTLWGSSPAQSLQRLHAGPPPACWRPAGLAPRTAPPCTRWKRISWRNPWRCPGPAAAAGCLHTWRTPGAICPRLSGGLDGKQTK